MAIEIPIKTNANHLYSKFTNQPTKQKQVDSVAPTNQKNLLKKDTVTLMGKEISKKRLACGIGALAILGGVVACFVKKNIARPKIKPKISTDEEFEAAMKKLMANPEFNEKWKQDDLVSSIVSVYAGYPDRSFSINGSLVEKDYTDNFINEVIRCLKYGLKKVDEKYGKYEGIVYRGGYFGEKNSTVSQSFISTSTDMDVPAKKMCRGGFHVIQTSHGHKIKDVQKALGSDYAESEKEILLDPNKKFEQIKELTPELVELKEKIIERLAWFEGCENDGEHALPPIRFWKEITD